MMNPAAIAAIAAGAIWLMWPASEIDQKAAITGQRAPVLTAPASQPPMQAGSIKFFAALPPSPPQLSAADSMAATRQHGDSQAPPIGSADAVRDLPTAAELADPKAYQAYEARQTKRVYASYVKAVDTELPILRGDIARGRALGIAPEEIAKAEDKARRLEQMRAQLLQEHPELGR